MSDDAVIGKVKVRVEPDTSKFKEQARLKLERIEPQLKALTVGVKVSETTLRSEAAKAVREVNKTLKADDRYKVKFSATISHIGMYADARAARKEFQRQADLTADIQFKAITALADLKIDEKAKDRATKSLQDWRDKISPLKVMVWPEMAYGPAKYTAARLAILSRPRIVSIIPVIPPGAQAKAMTAIAALSGGRAFKNLATDFTDFIGRLDKSVPRIAGVTTALTNLLSLVMTSVSNILTLGSSLATIVPAALALPGIAGGLALGLGASFAVLKDFNKVLPEVADKFHDLQDSMSAKFWDKAEEPMRRFINQIFPQFQSGMEDTSVKLGGFFASLSTSLAGKLDNQLGSMFDDLAKSIEIAADHTDDFAGIIRKLGSVGAGMLPRLAGWFGDISSRFNSFLRSAEKDGRLQGWIDRGVFALKDLASVLGSTGSVFSGLARAAEAAGGSTLKILRDTMQDVADVVNGDKFQKAMTSAFKGAHEGIEAITDGSGPQFRKFMIRLSETLGSVLPVAGEAAGNALGAIFDALDNPKVQKTVVDLFDKLNSAISTLAPAVPELVSAFTGVADVVGVLVENVAGALAPAIEKLGPKVRSLADDIMPVAEVLGDVLKVGVTLISAVLNVIPNSVFLGAGAFIALSTAMKAVASRVPVTTAGFATVRASLASTTASLAAVTRGYLTAGAASQRMAVQSAAHMANVKAQAGKLKGALGMGAGLAGTMLLMAGMAGKGETAMSNMATIGGGALLGFSVAGPIGAAVGGLGGLFLTLKQKTNAASEAAKASIPNWEALKGTLNKVSGAMTQLTKDEIYNQSNKKGGLFDSLKDENLSRREIVDGIMGEGDARAKLDSILRDSTAVYDGHMATIKELAAEKKNLPLTSSDAAVGNATEMASVKALADAELIRIENLRNGIGEMDASVAATKRQSKATTDFRELVGKIPKKVRVHIENNLPETGTKLGAVAKKFEGLSNKQIKVLIDFLGVETTVKDVRKVQDELTALDKTPIDMEAPARAVQAGMSDAAGKAREGGKKVASNLKTETSKAKPNLKPFSDSIIPALGGAKANATTGGNQVGSNLKAGVIAGFSGTQELLSQQAAAAVRSAIAAANAAGDIRSPSRETMKTGYNLGLGLAKGMFDAQPVAQAAGVSLGEGVVWSIGRTLVDAMDREMGDIEAWFSSKMSDLTSRIDSSMAKIKENAKKIRKAQARLKDGFKDDYKKLEGKEQKKAIAAAIKKAKAEIKRAKAEQKAAAQRARNASHILAAIEGEKRALDGLISRYEKKMVVLTAARDALTGLIEEQKSYAQSVSDAITATGDPTREGYDTFAAIKEVMQEARDEAIRFSRTITSLTAMGLNKTTIAQIVAAGPEAGLATAEAIAAAGVVGVDELNRLQADITSAGDELGKTASNVVFSSAIAEAAAEVARLEQELIPLEEKLRSAMESVMQAMVNEAIRGAQQIRDEIDKILGPEPTAHATSGNGNKGGKGGKNRNRNGKNGNKNAAVSSRTINYYAAEGSSSSKEDLFAAMDTARARWF